jgi:hypothetical protein
MGGRASHRLLSALLLALAASAGACRSCGAGSGAITGEGGPASAALPLKRAAAPPADGEAALAALAARLPRTQGSCAQVRSLRDEAEAEAVAAAIRKALQIPVELVRADLGERGIWWRICVGAEETEARLVARATRWTSPGGELEPFLDPALDGSPRFFVLSRERVEGRRPAPEQAAALLSFEPAPAAPVVFLRAAGGAGEGMIIASTAVAEPGGTDVVVVDERGARLGFDPSPAPGCATCALGLKEGGVVARRVLTAGDAAPDEGEELLVEEDLDGGVRLLSILAADVGQGRLRRLASLVLENARPGFVQRGRAGLVDGDLDPLKEIVLSTTELHVQGDAGCTLETHAAIYDLAAAGSGLTPIDPLKLPSEPVDGIIHVVTALDAWGDHEAASRACAGQLAREPAAALVQLCVQRVRRLLDGRALVAAVNAAGLAAEASPTLRPLLASPFYDAVAALDADPRLFAGELDCQKSPLVDGLGARPLEDSLARARARADQRIALADVADAVFVTGARDFGPESPIGAITSRWLGRARIALPARYAAIEALLLPQAPAPEAGGGGGSDGRADREDDAAAPGFGGGP